MLRDALVVVVVRGYHGEVGAATCVSWQRRRDAIEF
jgi:hypothetical protein